MNEKEFRELLRKAASGKASDKENELLERMLKGLRGPSPDLSGRNSSKAKVYARMQEQIQFSAGRKLFLQGFRYAASVLILLTIGFFVWKSLEKKSHNPLEVAYIQVNTGQGERKTIFLPDSSRVTLNSGSSLIYPDKFLTGKRHVNISGEGFFDVRKEDDRPFSIRAGEIIITVVGTSFNVYEDTESVTVTVTSGIVKVEKDKAEGHAILRVNQQFTYNKSSREGYIAAADAGKVSNWSRNILEFDDLELREALKMIEAWFNIEIVCKEEEILKRTLKGRYQERSLEYILEDLKFMMDLNYKIESDRVVLTLESE